MSQAQSEPIREPDEKEPEEKEACDFTDLEEWTFKDWCRNSLAQARCPPKPEVGQTQSKPVREPDEREPMEEETSEFTKLEVVLKDLRNSIAQMNHHLEPKAKASTEEKTTGNNALSTSEPQYN